MHHRTVVAARHIPRDVAANHGDRARTAPVRVFTEISRVLVPPLSLAGSPDATLRIVRSVALATGHTTH